MCRAWKDEFGHPELPDAAQTLELRGVDQRPRELIDRLIALKDDQAVYGSRKRWVRGAIIWGTYHEPPGFEREEKSGPAARAGCIVKCSLPSGL